MMPHKILNQIMWKKLIIVILFLIVAGGILLLLTNLFVCKVPADAITRITMRRIQVRICNYFSKTGGVPTKLENLPPDDPIYRQGIKDVWDNVIRYSVDGKTVTLLSLGKDNSLGGEYDNKDLILVFDPNNSNSLEAIIQNVQVKESNISE